MIYFNMDLNRNSSVSSVPRLWAGRIRVRFSSGATDAFVLRNVRLRSGSEAHHASCAGVRLFVPPDKAAGPCSRPLTPSGAEMKKFKL